MNVIKASFRDESAKVCYLFLLLFFAFPSSSAGIDVYFDQLVKTSEHHYISHDDHWPAGWSCVVERFTPDLSGVTISPLCGDTERTASPLSKTECPVYDSVDDAMAIQFTLNFNSIYDIGEWIIHCGNPDGSVIGPHFVHESCVDESDDYPCGWFPTSLSGSCVTYPSEPVYYIITVTNEAPTATITFSPAPAWNQTLTFDADAEDPDGGSLVYRWSIDNKPDTSTTTLLDAESEHPRLPLSSDDDIGIDEWRIRLDLDDNEGERRTFYSETFTVPNVSPEISIVGAPAIEIYIDQPIELEVNTFEDPDGGDLEITWELLDAPPATGRVPGVTHTGTGAAGAVMPAISATGANMGTWHFRVTARDNELIDRSIGDPVSDEVTVNVINRLPEVEIPGEELITISIGDPIQVDAVGSDPDGGLLHFRWDIIQAPQSADIIVQEGCFEEPETETSRLELSTVSTDCYAETPAHCFAGTWIIRVVVTDDEGDPNEGEVTRTIVVDAPPEARILGPEPAVIGILSLPLELDGGDSLDPDSRCDPPDYCHETLDGRAVTGISAGIQPPVGGYEWSLVDLSFESWDDYPLGRVDEVFGASAHLSSLSLGFDDLEQGDWTFQLSVTDGEGNEDAAAFAVSVIDENSPPVAVLSPPMRYTTDAEGDLSEAITLYGSASFDLDNIFAGEDPVSGITHYAWSILEMPPDCVPPVLPSGPIESTIDLYAMGARVPADCQGFWRIGLTVSDDDDPMKIGSGSTTVIIGNCPEDLCIDHPTTEQYDRVEFVPDTNIRIEYHLDSALYDGLAYDFGAFSVLEISHESDPDTPVFTSIDPNVLASDRGGKLVFNWNGYTDVEGRPRPVPGYYTVKVSLFDYLFARHDMAVEPDSIWLAVAKPLILPSSDQYASIDALKAGDDVLSINYEITGSATPDELRWRVLNETGTSVFGPGDPERRLLRPDPTGTISWNGRVNLPDDGTMLEPGNYTIVLEAFRSGASLGVSDPFAFTAFRVDLDVDTNRNATVDDVEDEANENNNLFDSGAIYTVNYDRDGLRDDGSGNPIPDAIHFNDDGNPVEEDYRVENDEDVLDLAPIVVRGPGVDMPSGLQFFLKFPEPSDVEMIHLFKARAAGETAVLGSATRSSPATEIDITNWLNRSSPDYLGDAEGAVTLGVEGLFFKNVGVVNHFRGYFDLALEVRQAGSVLFSDTVRMSVAPWIMLPHTQVTTEVWAQDAGSSNAAFRENASSASGYYGMDHSGQLCASGPCPDAAESGTQWLQDHVEIGYYQRPGGPLTHCVFRLPHYRLDSTEQPLWPIVKMLQPDVGVFQIGIDLGAGAADYGGNLQVSYPSTANPNGQMVIGDDISLELHNFITSQEVQPVFDIPVGWLRVGHIDEVINFTHNPAQVAVASPVLAFDLLDGIDPDDRGRSVFFATGAQPVSDEASADATADNRIETGIDHTGDTWNYIRIYEDSGSGAAGQVAHISHRGDGFLEIDEVWNTTSKVVPGSGASHYIMEYMFGTTTAPYSDTGWFNLPLRGDRYVLMEGTQAWRTGTPAVITVAEVLADSDLRNLNTVNAATLIEDEIKDALNDELDPDPVFVEVPVIFVGNRVGFDTGGSAVAFTPGLVNFQVVDNHLYFPRQFGPLDPSTGEDIFERETRRVLPDLFFVDDWVHYHINLGEVHCGTSAKRRIFTHDWWRTP